ncbi:glycosyltransferase family 4 protein [Amorphus sp. 3PC139-8]|uniref:glycosyltransferase family 4 protein n=1 Tax=Amorphus sp. 3PC139-8 TaxID=2735676 RepID=UPI00345D4430
MGRLAIVVKGYPRLSETFIAQEILGLERRGIETLIVSLRHPTDPTHHDLHDQIAADILYLPEYLKDDPARVRAGRRYAEGLAGYATARAAFDADLVRDRSNSRYRRFGQACVLAHELPTDVTHLHVHYLHTPASVTRYTALLTGMSWSFSAHAKDIWTTPKWELTEKLAEAEWGVTCTEVNTRYLRELSDRPETIDLVYHGLQLDRFPAEASRSARTGSEDDPVRILSVCRAVEKKGLDRLIRALAALPRDLNWRFEHIGAGPMTAKLTALADRLGIGDRVAFLGAKARDEVIAAYKASDLFVLASRIAKSGDRDGLPNVLMEAASTGLALLATNVSAIPELVRDGETGVLVPPDDVAALTAALSRLITEPETRARLGHAAALDVRERFSSEPGFDRLAARFAETSRRAA